MAILKHNSKGQALIIVLLVISALLISGAIFLKIVFSERSMVNLYIEKEKAFYIAEAGLEEGKAIVFANPTWFTDAPHSPDDDVNWLMEGAAGSVKQFGGGSYKIIRESGNNMIYSVGCYRNGRSVVRSRFNISPFKVSEFKIL
jgi:hypothetical protein